MIQHIFHAMFNYKLVVLHVPSNKKKHHNIFSNYNITFFLYVDKQK